MSGFMAGSRGELFGLASAYCFTTRARLVMADEGWQIWGSGRMAVGLVLAIIAVGSTLTILLLEARYGKQPILAFGGALIAASASAVFATWLFHRRRS